MGIVDGSNVYRYAANRPTVAVDPTGLRLKLVGPDQRRLKSLLQDVRDWRGGQTFRRGTAGEIVDGFLEIPECESVEKFSSFGKGEQILRRIIRHPATFSIGLANLTQPAEGRLHGVTNAVIEATPGDPDFGRLDGGSISIDARRTTSGGFVTARGNHIEEVDTVAHELLHAVHFMWIEDNTFYAREAKDLVFPSTPPSGLPSAWEQLRLRTTNPSTWKIGATSSIPEMWVRPLMRSFFGR